MLRVQPGPADIHIRALTAADKELITSGLSAYRAFLDRMDAHPGFTDLVTERRQALDSAQDALAHAGVGPVTLAEPAARALRLALDRLLMNALETDPSASTLDVPAFKDLCEHLDDAATAAGYDDWE